MMLAPLKPYIYAIILVFVSINILEKIPLFLIVTEQLSHKQKKKVSGQALIYTMAASFAIVLISKLLLWLTGVSTSDFRIAGGLLLFVLSVTFLLKGSIAIDPLSKKHFHFWGILPIAAPLIAGPALFIILIIILDGFGTIIAGSSLLLNIVLSWIILEHANTITTLIGEKGIASFSKVNNILLAAIAIMIIRQGIMEAFLK